MIAAQGKGSGRLPGCSCHPDDRPPVCQREHASTHCKLAYAEKLLAMATQFTLQRRGLYIGEPTETVKVEYRDKDRWVVTNGSEVLNMDGEWEYEPLPSGRGDAFKLRTRFSFNEALSRADAFLSKGETE